MDMEVKLKLYITEVAITQYYQNKMGGCQSASEGIQSPKKATFVLQNKFKKLEKHKFDLPVALNSKNQVISSNGKITDYITKNLANPVKLSYLQLDVGNSLDSDHKYVDKSFGNDSKSIGLKPIAEEIQWKRPSQFMKGSYFVFEGKIQPTDLKQGKLGDCYLLSAIAGISQYPFIVKRIFQTTQQSSYGAYGIWLFVDGQWECITLDDRFPVHNNNPLYSKNHGNQIWVMLIEKAYAKVFGSYEAIETGLTGVGMNALTGAPYQYICKDSTNKIDLGAAWDFISTHTSMNHILVGSTQNNDRNNTQGLLSTHAYTILDCQQVSYATKKGKKKQRILKLENPWGRYQWKGRWSDNSDVWTQELRQQLKYQQSDDGIFWMNIQDFIQNFGQICACKYNKNYINTSLSLSFPESQNGYKCMYLTTTNRTEGYITLYQKDFRFFVGENYEYSLVRVIILQIDRASKTLVKYIGDIMDCDRDASIYVQLDPADYYIIVEMDWKTNLTRDATLNFYGQHPVTLIEDKTPPNIQQLFNEIVILHENHTEQQRIYQYEKDNNIRRVTGSLAGYVYYHYTNKSKNNNYLCQSVVLKEKKFIEVDGEENKGQFIVKVYPQQERIVRLKVLKQGNSFYSFSTKIQFYIVEKYTIEKLRELTDKKPTKLKKREIQSKQIDVFVKSYNYSGGVAILYQNKMDKYAYVEELTLDIQNLELENEELPRSKKLQIELEPQSEKLLSFLVNTPGKQVIFRTKVAFYLNSPEFKF